MTISYLDPIIKVVNLLFYSNPQVMKGPPVIQLVCYCLFFRMKCFCFLPFPTVAIPKYRLINDVDNYMIIRVVGSSGCLDRLKEYWSVCTSSTLCLLMCWQ